MAARDALAVEDHPVLAALIDQLPATATALQAGVVARNVAAVQGHIAVARPPDADQVGVEANLAFAAPRPPNRQADGVGVRHSVTSAWRCGQQRSAAERRRVANTAAMDKIGVIAAGPGAAARSARRQRRRAKALSRSGGPFHDRHASLDRKSTRL